MLALGARGSCVKEPFWWEMRYERECKSEPLNEEEGQQGGMSKPSLLDAKQSKNTTFYHFIYFHKGSGAGFQPSLDGGG